MVQQICYQRPCSVVTNLTAVQSQDTEVVGTLHCLGQLLAVRLGEIKQVPLKIHSTVVDTAQLENKGRHKDQECQNNKIAVKITVTRTKIARTIKLPWK